MNSLRNLDLNLLVALDALLKEESITGAGKRLHLSPSATSGALSRLRDYFEDELLTQIGRRMVPTPLGELLRSNVRDCLLHIQATVDLRPGFDPLTSRRRYTLMMSDYVSTVLIPPALARMERQAPGIGIELLANETPWEALERGEVDLLVLPQNFVSREHPSEVLFTDDFVCICWSGNPLVGESLTVDQFFALKHAVAKPGRQRPPTIDTWFFERFGHARQVEVVAMNFSSLPHLLIGTSRIATVHRRLATVYAAALPLRVLEVPVPMPRLVEAIQWHRYRANDPARIWLYEQLRAVVASWPAAAQPESASSAAQGAEPSATDGAAR
jgi:LysR family transcriptional regulator, nod-box dependent transcriptional activator